MKNKVESEFVTRKYSWASDDKKLRAEMTYRYTSEWTRPKFVEFEMVGQGGHLIAKITLNLKGKPLPEDGQDRLFDDLIGTALVYEHGGGIVRE